MINNNNEFRINGKIINNDDLGNRKPQPSIPVVRPRITSPESLGQHYKEDIFIRNPNLEYLVKVLNLESNEIARKIAVLGYNFTYSDQAFTEENYLSKVRMAMSVVEDGIENDIKSFEGFKLLIENLIRNTSYTNMHGRSKDSLFRVRQYARTETIPVSIYYALSDALSKIGQLPLPPIEATRIMEFTPHGGMTTQAISTLNDKSKIPLDESLNTIWNKYKVSLEMLTVDRYNSLDLAIEGLYEMFNAWLVEGGNSSRCMILFNAVLIKLGISPVSHGVIDFAAYVMDLNQFKGYVRYVIGLTNR